MSHKKLEEISKFLQKDEKSSGKIKLAAPKKKTSDIEYIIKLYFSYDTLQKKQFYVLSIETAKKFPSLYEISVDVIKTKGVIDISILGLNARQSKIIKPQSAGTTLFFEDLLGKYRISLIKHDGGINSADIEFNVFKKEIILLKEVSIKKKNSLKFSNFIIDSTLFSFKE